jgi:GxxExxY protein
MDELIFKEETYAIVGACMSVHNYLGHGFLEVVYKDALEFELIQKNVSFEREKGYDINYKGKVLRHKFFADFFIMNKVIVEIKSTKKEYPKNILRKP